MTTSEIIKHWIIVSSDKKLMNKVIQVFGDCEAYREAMESNIFTPGQLIGLVGIGCPLI
jgi:hypothetical protein